MRYGSEAVGWGRQGGYPVGRSPATAAYGAFAYDSGMRRPARYERGYDWMVADPRRDFGKGYPRMRVGPDRF